MKTENQTNSVTEPQSGLLVSPPAVIDNATLRHQLLLIEEVEPRAEIKVWSFLGLHLPAFL